MPDAPPRIVTIPCLADNYAFLLHDPVTGATALIDAPEAAPIRAELDRCGWQLTDILITHHHGDHIDGVGALCAASGARVWGARADAHRLPALDMALEEGDTVSIGRLTGHVIAVPGHTVGHIAFYFPQVQAVFTADSLMALGCGRLFEGTAAQMWESLQKLAVLPGETWVYSGHEYTAANAQFAATIEPDYAPLRSRMAEIEVLRAKGQPTVPSLMATELATNPFLRAARADVKIAVGLPGAGDVECFAELRARKDRF
ncbi:MAG: hydroxyacylglutathione hydrolase [Rhodobacteraceae bacterium]|nr:hydroxyacylglutathione hydrolase [Paracoccaceae bacterium]